MVPTTLTCPNEELKNLMTAFHAAKQSNQTGAKLLGLRLEGPYFAKDQAGGKMSLHSETEPGGVSGDFRMVR